MNDSELFTTGTGGLIPQGDVARQAVDSLRGYAYQVTAAALAWLDIDAEGRLFLEVAEDYAIVAQAAIEAVQIKDTEASGNITLNTPSVQAAISSFLSLKASNPKANVQLRYFTTSKIGMEKAVDERPNETAGLEYWRKAATGADVRPLRLILESDKFSDAVQKFTKERDDAALRDDLLRKIHWECGKPNLTALRKELEDRLVVVGRNDFLLPAMEATRIADVLIYHVLEKSILKSPAERVLTRADLYRLVDQATRTSVPRATAEMLALMSSGLMTSALANNGEGLYVASRNPGWIIDGNTLPSVRFMVSRASVEDKVVDRLRMSGASIVIGASGLGKSSIARTVAERLAEEFVIIDFRNADAEETRIRLDTMVSRIGGLRAPIVLLEDINHLNDPLIAPSLARTFEALRRRDRMAIITCYLPSTVSTLSRMGLDVGCMVECPYFAEEETIELVKLHGGDPKIWGRIAFVTGAFGHPQLVHAFIAGVSARGWLRSDAMEIVGEGLSSKDIEAEREAARRNLISVLSENARNLLYRLSLTIGRFDRAMALAIADAPPPISQAGECIDALIGPWVETVGRDRYRVSPLAARSGQETISSAEQVKIHSLIANQFMSSRTVNGNYADAIMLHAMLGKNESVLVKLTHGILTADENTLGLLAESMTSFKLLGFNTPLYSDNLMVSGMLRLAQFKILVAARSVEKIGECVSSLFFEAAQLSKNEPEIMFHAMCYTIVLGTLGVANYLDNWLQLLQKFQSLAEANDFLSGLKNNYEKKNQQSSKLFGALFAVGGAAPSSIMKLEALIDQLNELDSPRRLLYLSGIGDSSSDYSVFINSAWSSDPQRNTLSAIDAANSYRRMAIKTAPWGVSSLTIQCWIAQAIMLDEYGKDYEGALKILDEAVETLGNNVPLSRARAKVYWRAQDHIRALAILREIADDVGQDNYIERAYALREAAISASKCGDWAQAETWFLESREAAAQSNLPDMTIMAIGLIADSAVAAIQIKGIERGLHGFKNALEAIACIDPTSSLRAMYCHQVIRHSILWALSRIANKNISIDGQPIAMEPGCCSNPEPSQAITERKLGPIDLAWYLLAESEAASGKSAGVVERLYDQLTDGPIPTLEITLRTTYIVHAIFNLNPSAFANYLWSHIEAIAHLSKNHKSMMETFDVFKPTPGIIASISRDNLSTQPVVSIASDAVFAYSIAAVCMDSTESLTDLESALRAEFGNDTPGAALFARINAASQIDQASSFDERLCDVIKWFKHTEHPTPDALCMAAITFFQHAGRSNFKDRLVPLIASWQRKEWSRIISSQKFSLLRPRQTVPAIELALSVEGDGNHFLANLFLAAASATGIALPKTMQAEFEQLAAISAAS